MSEQNQIQIWVLPYPVQGHINPMLQFTKRLASKSQSLTLTFLLPPSKSTSTINHPSIRFKPISDGTQQTQIFANIASYMDQFNQFVPHSLDNLIRQEHQTNDSKQAPLTVLIYDSATPWALDVARRHGLIGAAFFAQNCIVSSVYYRFSVGKLSEEVGQLPSLETRDLPSFLQDEKNSPKTILEMLGSKFRNLHLAQFVFFNTFDKLEPEAAEWMGRLWRIMAIGPTVPSMYLDEIFADDKHYGPSLLEPDVGEVALWLDKKKEGEVVYISFGTLANVNEEQMEEVAWALKNSSFSFLWVVREAEREKLPVGFVEEVLWKGLVVSWCSQLDVLSHAAVGCFVTHCGWNSVLEALSLGVPIVAMPQFSDQPTNAKFVQDVWKVGLRVETDSTGKLAQRDQIQTCIQEVLDGGKKGKVFKENADEWKRLSKEAVDEGGSSDKNIDQFVANVLSTSKECVNNPTPVSHE